MQDKSPAEAGPGLQLHCLLRKPVIKTDACKSRLTDQTSYISKQQLYQSASVFILCLLSTYIKYNSSFKNEIIALQPAL